MSIFEFSENSPTVPMKDSVPTTFGKAKKARKFASGSALVTGALPSQCREMLRERIEAQTAKWKRQAGIFKFSVTNRLRGFFEVKFPTSFQNPSPSLRTERTVYLGQKPNFMRNPASSPRYRRVLGGSGLKGFSLVEIVLALGVFSLAIVPVIGITQGLLGQSKESWQETRAAHIAQQVLQDLQLGSDDHGLLVKKELGSAESVEMVNLTEEGTYTVDYDSDARPVPLQDERAIFRMTLNLVPDENRQGLSQVEIAVRSPASAEGATPYRFFAKVAVAEMTFLP